MATIGGVAALEGSEICRVSRSAASGYGRLSFAGPRLPAAANTPQKVPIDLKSLLNSQSALSILFAGGASERSPVDGDADMISRKTYFQQACATCGRTLQVRVEYLGREVACQHCGAQFEACDPATALYPPSKSAMGVLRRAEELLDQAESGIFKIPTPSTTRRDGYATRPQ